MTQSHKLDRSLDPELFGCGVQTDSITTEEAARALQQQVNALMSQTAVLAAQLVSQLNIAQGPAELLGVITTVLSRSQAPTGRMLVDPQGLGKPPVFSGRGEDFYVWAKKVENYVSGDVPKRTWSFAEIDGQLFIVLSALTDGESFDVVMSAGGDHGFESWHKLHGRWNPYTAVRARCLLREILSPPRAKLLELTCAIVKMEDLVRRHCGRRDAQGNAHTLAEDIRMSSLEALLPDDLEKHVQLNRARLTSYGVLREEIKTYCE